MVALLRLLCAIEVFCNQSLYDNSDPQYYAACKANRWLMLPDYVNFVCQLVKLNSYCDMLAVLAASSVTQKAIQTLWPLSIAPGQLSPFTKLVFGRGLCSCRRPLQIMWTAAVTSASSPDINHFVPQIECISELPPVIDCDAPCRQDLSAVNINGNERSHELPQVIECEAASRPELSDVTACINDHVDTVTGDCTADLHSGNDAANVDSHSAEHVIGTPLVDDKFLSFATCMNLVTSSDQSSIVLNVPHGVKSNVYFLLSTSDNDRRVANGQQRAFVDDCGAWSHTRGYKSVVVGNNVKELYKRNGAVCDRKCVDGKEGPTSSPGPTT